MYVIHAKRICDKYFHGDKSMMEVDIQKKDYDEIWRKLMKRQADRTFFDAVLVPIKEKIVDTLTRFKLSSSDYRKYLMEIKVAKNLMDQEEDEKKKTGIFRRVVKNFRKKTGTFVKVPGKTNDIEMKELSRTKKSI